MTRNNETKALDKMNIYQKLIEVRKAVPYLKKNNKGYQYKYVSSSQTLEALRGELDKQGLLLVPKVLDTNVTTETVENTDKYGNIKKTTTYFTELKMEFIWINAENPEEKLSCLWYGQGVDIAGEKGVGKALTYAEKYFLLKFFNIATDKDDPDNPPKKDNNGQDAGQKNRKPLQSKGKQTTGIKTNKATQDQLKIIKNLKNDKKLSKAEVKLIDAELDKNPTEERIDQIIKRIEELIKSRTSAKKETDVSRNKGGVDNEKSKREETKEKVLV